MIGAKQGVLAGQNELYVSCFPTNSVYVYGLEEKIRFENMIVKIIFKRYLYWIFCLFGEKCMAKNKDSSTIRCENLGKIFKVVTL